MGRCHRYIDDATPGGPIVELTLRVVGATFLLRPSDAIEQIIVGVLGEGLRRMPQALRFHELAQLSNHTHALASPSCMEALSDFQQFVNGQLARRAGWEVEWLGRVWGGRYSLSQVFPSRQRARQRYLWAQGLPENLIASPYDNPCINSLKAKARGKFALHGTWYDKTAMSKAGVGWHDPRREQFGERRVVPLHPLPIDSGKTKAELVQHARAVARELTEQHARRRRAEGVTHVLGADRMRALTPFERSKRPKHGRAAPLAFGTPAEVEAFRERHAAAGEQIRATFADWARKLDLSDYPEQATLPSVIRAGLRRAQEADLKAAEVLVEAGHPEKAKALLARLPRRRAWPALPPAPEIAPAPARPPKRAKSPKRRRVLRRRITLHRRRGVRRVAKPGSRRRRAVGRRGFVGRAVRVVLAPELGARPIHVLLRRVRGAIPRAEDAG